MTNVKLTKAQAEAIASMTHKYAQAQTDFETWFMTSNFCNGGFKRYDSFQQAVEDHYGFFARRDQPNDIEGYYKEHLNFCRGYYEKFRNGVIDAHISSNTLRALEKKGLVEILIDGKRHTDWVRLLYI